MYENIQHVACITKQYLAHKGSKNKEIQKKKLRTAEQTGKKKPTQELLRTDKGKHSGTSGYKHYDKQLRINQNKQVRTNS